MSTRAEERSGVWFLITPIYYPNPTLVFTSNENLTSPAAYFNATYSGYTLYSFSKPVEPSTTNSESYPYYPPFISPMN